jgi:hypothetical protein
MEQWGVLVASAQVINISHSLCETTIHYLSIRGLLEYW